MEISSSGQLTPNLLIAKGMNTISIGTLRALGRTLQICTRLTLGFAILIGFLFSASSRGQAQNRAALTSAILSANFFDFGNNVVGNTLTQTVAIVTNAGPNTLSMNPRIAGSKGYAIVQDQSCGSLPWRQPPAAL